MPDYNINGVGIGLNTNFQKNEPTTEVKEDLVQNNTQQNSAAILVPQEDILNALAQQGALNKSVINAPKSYDVQKYNTPEQAQRIAGLMASFEDVVAQNLQAITAEFGTGLSEADKMNIALFTADKMVS